MKKILISGYYGFGNIGDEAILQAMVVELNKRAGVEDITVLSNTPTQTELEIGVKAVNRSSISQVVKSIKDCEVLISGGGSLLQDGTSRISIYYYLFIYFVAMILKKKIIIFSHGIGPVNKKMNKKLIKFVFNRVSSISVRDEESKEELIGYGVGAKSIDVTADPVISYTKKGAELGVETLSSYDENYDPKLPSIGMALKSSKKTCIKSDIVKVIKTLKEKQPCNIILLPFHYSEDLSLIQEIKVLSGERIIVADKRHSVDEMFSMIESLDVLIGVRLHALIFAAVVNTPVVGISYDPKIDAFLKSVDENVSCTIDQLNVEGIIEKIEDIVGNQKVYREKISSKTTALKVKLSQYNSRIKKILE